MDVKQIKYQYQIMVHFQSPLISFDPHCPVIDQVLLSPAFCTLFLMHIFHFNRRWKFILPIDLIPCTCISVQSDYESCRTCHANFENDRDVSESKAGNAVDKQRQLRGPAGLNIVIPHNH